MYNSSFTRLAYTDIKSFLKLRTAQYIYDEYGHLIGIVEEEVLNTIMNKMITDNKIESIYRRYTIYAPDKQIIIGVTRKVALLDTYIEFVDPSETIIFARATKSFTSKSVLSKCGLASRNIGA